MIPTLRRPLIARGGERPIGLTPFERYMAVDERAGWPMTFFMEVDLVGDLDREAFDEALRAAVAEQPLLSARLERTLLGGHRWRPYRFTAPPVEWLADLPPGEAPVTGVRPSSARPGAFTEAVAGDGGRPPEFGRAVERWLESGPT